MTSIDQRLAALLLTSFANLALGFAVWRKNPSQRVNQCFALLTTSIATWALSNGLVNRFAATPDGIIWARAAFVSAAAIPLSFFLFVSVFPTPRPSPPRAISRLFLACALLVVGLSTTPAIAQSTSLVNGVLQVTYGPLHTAFGIYFVSGLAYCVTLLYAKLRALTGIERLQVRYVFLGISLAMLGGTITNLVIPLLFGSSQFSGIGPLFSIVMLSLIAHAIIRYRVLNMRLAMRRGFGYLVGISAVGVAFTITLWLIARLAVPSAAQLPFWILLALVLAVAVPFQPLRSGVQRRADRYFFRESYDYQRVVRDISRNMAAILDLQSLLRYCCEAITRTVQSEYVAAFAKDSLIGFYRPLILHRAVADAPTLTLIDAESPLLTYLTRTKQSLLADELNRIAPPEGRPLQQQLRSLRADIVLPMHDDKSVTGFFLIGPKLSGDPYFSDDLDLLSTLASQATVALNNAQLYSQVVLANDYVENILGTIDSAVIAVDDNGAVTRFNAAAERLTGLSSAHAKGTSVRDLPASISDLLQSTAADHRARIQIETTITNDTSHDVTPVICSISPLVDRSGASLGAVAVINDLTGIRRLEEEKRQVERLASIGALASGIAHEIKNPLVAIKTFAELLPERFSEDDFRNDFSRVAIKEIERIDDLVARLRGLAMPSQQALAPLDIKSLLDDTIALLRGQLEQSRIQVRLTSDEDLPPVAGSIAQLKQLFLNLLINAVEASAPGAGLTVHLRKRTMPEGQGVTVDIIDSGSGIPDNLLGMIFEPFITTKPRGSGLGLSICRGIADAHRAKIAARNNVPGRGATVTVEFPSSRQVPAAITF